MSCPKVAAKELRRVRRRRHQKNGSVENASKWWIMMREIAQTMFFHDAGQCSFVM
jgi:hypothetical protein